MVDRVTFMLPVLIGATYKDHFVSICVCVCFHLSDSHTLLSKVPPAI